MSRKLPQEAAPSLQHAEPPESHADGNGQVGAPLAPKPFSLRLRYYFLVELALWFTVPMIFLCIYVVRFHNPPSVILEHLYPVALIAGFCLMVKVCLRRLLPWRMLADALSTVVYVSALMLLSAYYLLVAIGLRAWGKVISEELIFANAAQLPQLCETVGMSYRAILAGVVAVWVILVSLHFVLARRFEPVTLRTIRFPNALTTVISLAVTVLLMQRIDIFTTYPDIRTTEPFQMTLTMGKGAGAVREHNIQYDPAFEKDEIAARENYRPAASARRRNVILIIADGLRADRTEPYGYTRATTPYFKQILASGEFEKFDNVHSFCSESNCGTVSLLASRDPSRVPLQPFTFSQVLQRHGYGIHMIMGGDQTNYYNKRSLFGKVDSYFDGFMAMSEGYFSSDDSFVLPKAKELPKWNGKPVMLQFHFMSTHIMGKRLPPFEKFLPSETYAGKTKGAPEARYTNFYDNGVYQFDAFVAQTLDIIRKKNYLDDAIIIITSDHGESLGERDRYMHGWGVHEPLLHVPLFISGLKPRTQQAAGDKPFIAQPDILPTVLHELGMPLPATWIGQPIQQLQALGNNQALSRFAMHESAGVFDGRESGRRWKYSINRYTEEELVYDLSTDPNEVTNLLWKVPVELADEWRRGAGVR